MSRPYDEFFGQLCRYLMKTGQTMHQDRKGRIVVKRKRGKPHPRARI